MPNKDINKKNEANKRHYHRNKARISEKLKETSKEYYSKNKELFLFRAKLSREKNYEKQMLRSINNRALRDGIPFDLALEDIQIPELCPYLKIPLTRFQGKGRVWTNASVDRKDNSLGYVKGNIQIISMKANLMKAHATQAELETFAKAALNEQLLEYINA